MQLIRAEVAAARIDFLLFADIGMEFTSYALAFSRLAPFQVRAVFPLLIVKLSYICY